MEQVIMFLVKTLVVVEVGVIPAHRVTLLLHQVQQTQAAGVVEHQPTILTTTAPGNPVVMAVLG